MQVFRKKFNTGKTTHRYRLNMTMGTSFNTCRLFSAQNTCPMEHSPHCLPLGSKRLPVQSFSSKAASFGDFTLPMLWPESPWNFSKMPMDVRIGGLFAWFLGFPCWLLNYRALHWEEGSGESPSGSLLQYFFAFFSCHLVADPSPASNCLHAGQNRHEKIQTMLSAPEMTSSTVPNHRAGASGLCSSA